MNKASLVKRSEWAWEIPRTGGMRVPGVLYASEPLIEELDNKVYEQLSNVAALPGIVNAAYAMPDAHWGYGFPIGGVAAFDPQEGGVISAGGVGFDISCGVRTMLTPFSYRDLHALRAKLADALFYHIPAGVGSTSRLRLNARDMTAMLAGGGKWAVDQGYGLPGDVARIENQGLCADADPDEVSKEARRRQVEEMGTLGPGSPALPACYREVGQPVLVGGTMGTASYILVGAADGDQLAFSSACHGAGRSQSRSQALKQYRGEDVVETLRGRNITIKTRSYRGVAEEAPAAYKDVSEVVRASAGAGLAGVVARLEPMICVKG